MHDTLHNFYSSALQCLPATWWMVRVQRLLKYLLKKKMLICHWSGHSNMDLEVNSRLRASGGRMSGEGWGRGGEERGRMEEEVVTACSGGWLTTVHSEWPDLLLLPRAISTHTHTHTHTDKMTRSYRSKRAVLCLILWLLCFKRLASDRPSIFVYAAPPLCASFTPFPLAFTCFLISPSLSPTLSPNSQQQ